MYHRVYLLRFWHTFRHKELRPGIDNNGVLKKTKGGGKPIQVYKAQKRKQKKQSSKPKTDKENGIPAVMTDDGSSAENVSILTKEPKSKPQKMQNIDTAGGSQDVRKVAQPVIL